MKKGHQVYLEGHLRLDQWKDKNDGTKRSKLKIVLDDFQFLEPRQDGMSGEGGTPRATRGECAGRSATLGAGRAGRQQQLRRARAGPRGRSRRPERRTFPSKEGSSSKTGSIMATKQRHQVLKGTHGGMQLVLTEDVAHLGKQGDVVEVKPGYGRNYLLPRAWPPCRPSTTCGCWSATRCASRRPARPASPTSRRWPSRFARTPITIEANANEEGHLYGSVGAAEIAKALKAKNLPIEPDMVQDGRADQGDRAVRRQAEPRLRDRQRGQGRRRQGWPEKK